MKTLDDIKKDGWESGINQVWNADCLEAMKLIPDKSIDLVLTDPPYVIGAKECGLAGDRQYLHDITENKLDKGFDMNVLSEYERILKRMNLIIFCGRLQLKDFIDWIYQRDYTWNLLCWHKTDPTPLTNNNYLPDTEYMFHVWKDRKLGGDYSSKKKFYILPREEKYHPTGKPIALIGNLIKTASEENEIVLDSYLGGGSTAVTAKQLGRRFIGIEISQKYCKIAEDRLRQEMLFT